MVNSDSAPVKIHFVHAEPGSGVIPLYLALQDQEKLAGTDRTGTEQDRYVRLSEKISDFFLSVEPAEADLFFYPYCYDDNSETKAACQLAKSYGKPCIFFRGTDEVHPDVPENGLVYRTSILKSTLTPQERAAPAFSDDFLRKHDNKVLLREKSDLLSVGFCGYIGTPLYRLLFHLQGRHQKSHGLKLRNKTLNILEKTPGIQTNFIKRTQFWGGALGRFKSDLQTATQVRDEYLNSLFNNDYTICIRGAGNFSFRFYETLACGRIPLFVNTDCLLPFADEINWKEHCVWVEEKELPNLGTILRDFHQKISADDFKKMQLKNRQLWEKYLRPLECYQHICRREIAAISS